MKDPLRAEVSELDTLISCPRDHRAHITLAPASCPFLSVCTRGWGQGGAVLAWAEGSYKMVHSIHTQDHVTVWDMMGGPVWSYETIGV